MAKLSYYVDLLTPLAYRAFEQARASARSRNNHLVELSHWFEQLVLTDGSDVQLICRHFGIELGHLAAALTRELDALDRGTSMSVAYSQDFDDALVSAKALTDDVFGDLPLRSGHVLCAVLSHRTLRPVMRKMYPGFFKIDHVVLLNEFGAITNGSVEAPAVGSDTPAPSQSVRGQGDASALEKYATNLTARAQSGGIDPIVGRDHEIRQMVDILMRRRQNNPILVGEAGVGKTAVVEGFALRIARGDVPPMLSGVQVWSLDIGLMQAGASMKGEFEQRLRDVMDEVQSSETPIILFIDEAHTLIGAGGATGTGDAANLLKPALARGELRTVAATTWAEYKKHIEKDPALSRRFEAVQVEEPSEEKALLMMRGIASTLEGHHRIQILDEALEAAVQLSNRYVPARQLPDKAVALLDTVCARISVSQHAVPAEVEVAQRRLEALDVEAAIIAREEAMGIETAERAASVVAEREAASAELAAVEAKCAAEKALVDEILALRARLRVGLGAVDETDGDLDPENGVEVEAAVAETSSPSALEGDERTAVLDELRARNAELAQLQGDSPSILASADRQAVAKVVEDWTGIPVARMSSDEIQTILDMPQLLAQRVVSQDHAMEMIAKRVETSRAGLTAPEKPVGVFMLAGPSGVGKTETALALAELLYGGEQNLITINMSEFQERHTVSTLKGAPPGYVGYGEGGVLTEAVRRRPYSVVLLDEIEKAHSDVHEVFFQVFDKGIMEDGEGRRINFKNALIVLTTNVGTDLIMKMCEDPELMPDATALGQALRTPLLEAFPPAFLGRLSVIPYFPLSDDTIDMIARLKLKSVQSRVKRIHGAELTYDDAVLAQIRARCTEIESGGRMIDAILTNTLLPAVSREVLNRMAEGSSFHTIAVSVENDEFVYRISPAASGATETLADTGDAGAGPD